MSEVTRGDALIEVRGVSKWFGNVVAVSDVSFDIGPGITALLGPNGAGKSTMLRMLCGLARPSKGTVRLLGSDPRSNIDVTRQLGLVPQQEGVFEPLTALAFVRLSATLYGLPDPDGAARAALATVELDAADERRLPTYSKGMRQRVKLAQAIVHDPRLIVLDEPLTGLDPRQRAHMIELFHRLGGDGRCVVVTSHVLDEVERFGSDVLVMAKGRLAAAGDFREIRALMDDRPRRVVVRTSEPQAARCRSVACRCRRRRAHRGRRRPDARHRGRTWPRPRDRAARPRAWCERARGARRRRGSRGRLPLPGGAMSSAPATEPVARSSRSSSFVALYRLVAAAAGDAARE